MSIHGFKAEPVLGLHLLYFRRLLERNPLELSPYSLIFHLFHQTNCKTHRRQYHI